MRNQGMKLGTEVQELIEKKRKLEDRIGLMSEELKAVEGVSREGEGSS